MKYLQYMWYSYLYTLYLQLFAQSSYNYMYKQSILHVYAKYFMNCLENIEGSTLSFQDWEINV